MKLKEFSKRSPIDTSCKAGFKHYQEKQGVVYKGVNLKINIGRCAQKSSVSMKKVDSE